MGRRESSLPHKLILQSIRPSIMRERLLLFLLLIPLLMRLVEMDISLSAALTSSEHNSPLRKKGRGWGSKNKHTPM